MNGLSWGWIALQAVAPMGLGFLVAWPIWRRGQPILGSLTGALVLAGSAIALILREYVAIDRLTADCLAQGFTCWPEPSAFSRYAVYALIGLVQIYILFIASVRFDNRRRQRLYAPQWRR